MSITTTYSCDRCGIKSADNAGFFNVSVHITNLTAHRAANSPRASAMWCASCCTKRKIDRQSVV